MNSGPYLLPVAVRKVSRIRRIPFIPRGKREIKRGMDALEKRSIFQSVTVKLSGPHRNLSAS